MENVSKTYERGYKYIVLHHTATEKCMSAEEMKMSMFYTYVQNRGFEYIPTHYIVGCSGDFVKVNELDRIVGATLNGDANRDGIHIEIVGDFNNGEPNQSQYDMVNQLIERILEKYPNMEIKGHGDFQAKNCPGINFDWTKIKGNITSKYFSGESQNLRDVIGEKNTGNTGQSKKQVSNFSNSKSQKKGEEITFSLSRYYTVVPNQKRYYNGRTYEEDFKINCAGDCNVTADGHVLQNSDVGKVVACPKEYKLGTKFYVEGIGVVVCHDRGGAIQKQGEVIRLDLWMGIGDIGLDNIYNNKYRGGEYKGYLIE